MSDVNDAYERDAEAFYRATGFMAPGKDQPTASPNGISDEIRMLAWRGFLTTPVQSEPVVRPRLYCDHPLPWRYEQDWLAEIYDANGKLVVKAPAGTDFMRGLIELVRAPKGENDG